MTLPYNPKNKQSIIDFAKILKGKTLRDVCDETILKNNYSGKGKFGQLLEKFYFQYNPNSVSEADFYEVGMELKSSPLKQLKNKEYRSKERLVLNIINYIKVADQDFETSSFWKKNASLLLVFYLYEIGLKSFDYIIKLVDEWNFPSVDLKIIKNDWELIKTKIVEGKAHELSEGDTFYLGACTKGGKGGNLRKQPNNKIKAKQRAYSLKQGYVNHIIASISNSSIEIYGKLISDAKQLEKQSIEKFVILKFESYYGKTISELNKKFNLKLNPKAKNFYANITNAILNIELGKEIEEFKKADIIIRTVRLKENDLPEEDVSFSAFKYEELLKEKWDESKFKEDFTKKFLFIFLKTENEKLVLKKVRFWNIPYKDLMKAKKVWTETRKVVRTGNIVKELKGKIRRTNFPKKSFNSVSHVRPHAKNTDDTFILPVIDKITNANKYTKHCFWLNNSYIKDEIYLKKT